MIKPIPSNFKEMQSFLVFVGYYIKEILASSPILLMCDSTKTFKLYVDASIEGLGTALHHVQIVNDFPKEGVIFYISTLKDSKKKCVASK